MLLRRIFIACGLALLGMIPAFAADGITQTERGAVIETDRYKVEFYEGYLRSIINKLTGEEYLDTTVAPDKFLPNLPAGMGTQAGKEAFKASDTLYHWPWYEHPVDAYWPNQHYADNKAKFTFTAKGEKACTLAYSGLGDGKASYGDEGFGLDIEVDEKTGDLLVTPWGKSPRPGVYSANLNVAPLAPAVTAETPIFDGVRLDRNMAHTLWANAWGGYWDYAFVAFNGYKKGAVTIWNQDAELKYYKTLFYLINPEGISFSFSYMNIPPFDTLTESRAATPWRLQAFDKSWAQGAARFREWRLANVKIAPRPEWAKHISYVSLMSTGNKVGLDKLKAYFDGSKECLERVANFAATVRKAKFDTRHYDNTPYDAFAEDMKAWKESGAKFMAYLQPMIMWGAPGKDEKQEYHDIYSKHIDADTRGVFQEEKGTVVPLMDQHHLGHKEFQRWFLDGVKSYVQDYGAAGVYHDQSYHCPIDSRGLADKLGNMTTTQGMADYFYKVATETPNSIHATEHMTEVNNVGASLGIAGGILWSTPTSMRMQRIKHASCISASLSYPNGVLFAFPHYSDLTRLHARHFNWGQDLMEMRAEIAGGYPIADATQRPFFRNHFWIDDERTQTFVRVGLRPEFPEDFDRNVRSYFKGAKGEDLRYVNRPWGSALVEFDEGGKEKAMRYGRAHGAYEAKTLQGGVYGWGMYNADGPAGLHPDRYYPIDSRVQRPQIWLSPANKFTAGLYEAYAEDCVTTDNYLWAILKPGPRSSIIETDEMLIHAPKKPYKVIINGYDRTAGLNDKGDGAWWVNFRTNDIIGSTTVLVLLDEPKQGEESFRKLFLSRATLMDDTLDIFDHQYMRNNTKIKYVKGGESIEVACPKLGSQLILVLTPPEGAKTPGTMKIELKQPVKEVFVNGLFDSKGGPRISTLNLQGGEIPFVKDGEFAVVVLRGAPNNFKTIMANITWTGAATESSKK